MEIRDFRNLTPQEWWVAASWTMGMQGNRNQNPLAGQNAENHPAHTLFPAGSQTSPLLDFVNGDASEAPMGTLDGKPIRRP